LRGDRATLSEHGVPVLDTTDVNDRKKLSDKIADHKFRGWKPTTRVNGCIMWGSGGKADVRPSYCDTCLDIIKARRLDDIRKDWASRGASAG